MNRGFYALCLLGVALCHGCTAQKPTWQEPVTFASLEDFKSGPEGGVDLVWSTNRIQDAETLKATLQKYDSLILERTWIVVDKESSRTLDDEQILEISRHMVKAIQTRFGQGFRLVETPVESTLRLSLALTDLATLSPILAASGRLLPFGHGTASVSTIVPGEPDKLGSVTVELLVSDARTNEPLIAAIDKHFSARNLTTTVASPGDAQRAISLWVDRLWITLRDWNWIKQSRASR